MRTYLAFPVGIFLGLSGASPVGAEQPDFVAQVLSALRLQGYREVWFEQTLLNRVRITAKHMGFSREIVIDPRTGEILRDLNQTPIGEVPERGGNGILTQDVRKGSRDDAESPQEERDSNDAEESGRFD